MNAVFDIVVPIFSIVLLGYSLARAGIFTASTSEGLTGFMFYVAVPAMLFKTLATTTLPATFPWGYLLAFYGASFFVFFSGIIFSRRHFSWSKQDQGIAAISASYSNMVMLGIPLVLSAFGERGALPLFILLAFQSTLLFPATTWMIEVYGRTHDGKRTNVLLSAAKLLLNPVILSLALGVATNLLLVQIPDTPARILETIGAAAPACALVALGVGLAQYEIRGDIKASLVLVFLKGIVHPILVLIGCWAFNVSTLWTQVAVLLAAMPTGINAFIYARNYNIRVAVVTKTIVLSTLVSTVTVSLLLHFFLN